MNRTIVFFHASLRELCLRKHFRDIQPAFRRRMARAMESLPELQYEVLRLVRHENLSFAEVAARLNLTCEQVENHLALALEILWRSLERQERKGW